MKQIMKWSIILMAGLAVHHYSEAAGNGMPGDVYRVKYDRSIDMPDHLAYLSLMQNITQAQREAGTEANLDHIQLHLSLNREDAREFLEYVQSSYVEMIDNNRAVTNRMLCAGDRPKYEINKAYAVLDVLDDIKETNLRKHYKRVQIDFGSQTADELENWLMAIKTGSSHHKYDHRKVFEHSEHSVEDVISTACNLLASWTPLD